MHVDPKCVLTFSKAGNQLLFTNTVVVYGFSDRLLFYKCVVICITKICCLSTIKQTFALYVFFYMVTADASSVSAGQLFWKVLVSTEF